MLVIGVMDFSLEQTIVIPALPAIGARFDASVTAVTWLLTGFLTSAAVATPLAGRLGDRYGRRRLLVLSLATFAVGSLVCAIGQSIGVLIAGRVLQGLGAGCGPLAFALLPATVPPERFSRSVGLLIGAGGLGSVVGLLAAGPLVDHVSVSAIFWLLCVVAGGLAVAVARYVPESPDRSRRGIDWVGAVVLSVLLAALVLGISQGNEWGWTNATIAGLFAVSAIALVLFAVRTATAAEPLLDPSSLRRPAVLAANVTTFVIGVALFGAYVLVPYIGGLPRSTGYGLGLTTTEISLLLTPGSVAAFIGGVAGGRLVERLGARQQAMAAVGCTVVAYVALAALPRTAVVMSLALVPLGFGIGAALVGIVALLMMSAEGDETAAAVAVNSVLRAVGSAVGSQAAVAILLASRQLAPGVPVEWGFTRAFVVGLLGSVVALAVMVLLPPDSPDPVAGSRRT